MNIQKEEIVVESRAQKNTNIHMLKSKLYLNDQTEVATYPEELIEDAEAECGPISKDAFASTVVLLAEDKGAAEPSMGDIGGI